MRFRELKECPFCGSDTFFEKQKVKGYLYYNMRFDGDNDHAHNEDLYDTLDISENGKAYCLQCYKYLGNYIDDTVSKSVENKLSQRR